jgi:DNA-directed RNA polymerase specialized sigma24 family protein
MVTLPDNVEPDRDDIESEAFVLRLKMGSDEAWRTLEAYADQPLSLLIYKASIDAHLPLELADEIKASVWMRARREISKFQFEERGGVFRWLNKLHQHLNVIYQNMESDDFIGLLRLQDYGAWSLLFQTYYRNMYLGALAHLTSGLPKSPIGKNEQDAESIVHQTWEVARQRIDSFKHPPSALLAWILSIVKNLTMNHIRREKFRCHIQLDDIEETVPAKRATVTIDGEEIDVERMRAILEEAIAIVLANLPNSDARDQVYRRLWLNHKPNEIHRSYPNSDLKKMYDLFKSARRNLKTQVLDILHGNVSGGLKTWLK